MLRQMNKQGYGTSGGPVSCSHAQHAYAGASNHTPSLTHTHAHTDAYPHTNTPTRPRSHPHYRHTRNAHRQADDYHQCAQTALSRWLRILIALEKALTAWREGTDVFEDIQRTALTTSSVGTGCVSTANAAVLPGGSTSPRPMASICACTGGERREKCALRHGGGNVWRAGKGAQNLRTHARIHARTRAPTDPHPHRHTDTHTHTHTSKYVSTSMPASPRRRMSCMATGTEYPFQKLSTLVGMPCSPPWKSVTPS